MVKSLTNSSGKLGFPLNSQETVENRRQIEKKEAVSGNVPESEDEEGGNGEGSRHWSSRERNSEERERGKTLL